MPTCINLRTTYGGKYRIEYEPSYYAEHGAHAYTDDPWLQILPCQSGHIGVFGGDELFASTDRSGSVAKALRSLDCCRVWMDGADGLNVVFNVAHAKRVFAVMKPRRKRQLSPEQRQAAVERLAKYRFPSARNDAPDERQRTLSPLDVQSHQPGIA